jgi:hypothetical protein
MAKLSWMRASALAGLGLAAAAGTANTPRRADPDIVVRGQSGKAIDNFLKNATPTTQGNQIARWNDRLCLALLDFAPVTGDPVAEKFIKDRVYSTAKAYRVPVAPSPSCAPNVSVIFTNDSDALTSAIFTTYTRHYQDLENHWLTGEQIQQAKASRAIRWLSADSSVGGEGSQIASHIKRQTFATIVSSIIIIDIQRVRGLKWGQLADYITMVALTNPKLGGDYASRDSILGLFGEARDQAPKALTMQDRKLLAGLYRSDNMTSASDQRNEMKRIMKRQAQHGQQEPADQP